MSQIKSHPAPKIQPLQPIYEHGQTPTFSQSFSNTSPHPQNGNTFYHNQRTYQPQTTYTPNTANMSTTKQHLELGHNPNNHEQFQAYENINSQYIDLKNKVEDRIRLLQTKCTFLDQDPNRTRISFGSNTGNNSNWAAVTKKPGENEQFHNHINSKSNYVSHKRQQSGHTDSHQNLSQQYLRAHCYSIDSNTGVYLHQSQQRIPETNIINMFNRQPPPVQSAQVTKNISVLPSQSNTSNNTLFQQNINEAIIQNLKAQKQLNQNLKTLSQRLSDFSVRRSESSQYIDENRKNSRVIPKDRYQNEPNRQYGSCWRCESLISDSKKNDRNNFRHQKYRQDQYLHNKFVDEGSSSQSYPPINTHKKLPQNQRESFRKREEVGKKIRSGSSLNKHSHRKHFIDLTSNKKQCQKNNSKRQKSVQSRAKSVSISSSSHNSKNKIYTFRGKNKHLQRERAEEITSGQEKQKGSRNNIELDSEYYVSRENKRNKKEGNLCQHHSPQKRKNEREDGCWVHGSNDVLQIYDRKVRQKNGEVYRDSEYRNRKHEKQHLLQSFQQQQRLRRELLEKIGRNFFNSYGVK